MSEGDIRHHPADVRRDATPHGWNIAAIGRALNAAPAPTHDVREGRGVRFALRDEPGLGVEIFPGAEPGAGTLRLTLGANAELRLFRQSPPEIGVTSGLIFSTAPRFLEITPAGTLTLLHEPSRRTAQGAASSGERLVDRNRPKRAPRTILCPHRRQPTTLPLRPNTGANATRPNASSRAV